jgi:ATP-dependent Clp protease ATP-binding subunit ClpA
MNTNDELPVTPRVKAALKKAHDFAKKCEHSYVGTEHLLVGLLEFGNEAPSGKIMSQFGIHIEALNEFVKNETKKTVHQTRQPTTEIKEVVAMMRMIADRLENL